jgi:orotate phosphoribosyltransferase-like protein
MPESLPPCQVVIADICPKDFQILSSLGIAVADYLSWRNFEGATRQGLLALLTEAAGISFGESLIHQIPVPLKEESDLTGVFSHFIRDLDQQVPSALDVTPSSEILVLNLMPFVMSASRVDKIVRAVFFGDAKMRLARYSKVVVFLRNIDWLLISQAFREFRKEGHPAFDVISVDQRCFMDRFSSDRDPERGEVEKEKFRGMLDLDDEHIYYSLIYNTNSYIGHFKLHAAHLRTHYDLTQFIKRDNVWHYFLRQFEQITIGMSTLLVIGVGMEQRVIQTIGDQLQSSLQERTSIKFESTYGGMPANFIPTDWASIYCAAILVTDIVCTGQTLAPWVDELKRRNDRGKPIRVFAIAAMANTVSEVGGVPINRATTIRRDFFYPENCALCDVHQPHTEVTTLEDFHAVEQGQLTPLDFWEIVTDAQALEYDVVNPDGRPLAYRINTERIVKRYGQWLGNVIKHRVDDVWPNLKIDAICTVDEEFGAAFAELVRDSLDISEVKKVGRDTLTRITPRGGLPQGVDPFREAVAEILVVDDGLNSGDTMLKLIQFCRAAGKVPVGALVLDSRLSEPQVKKLTAQMSGRSLVALYTWPGNLGF